MPGAAEQDNACDEKEGAQLSAVLVTHTLPNHSCFVLKDTVSTLTQAVHSFFYQLILLNAAGHILS